MCLVRVWWETHNHLFIILGVYQMKKKITQFFSQHSILNILFQLLSKVCIPGQ
ncbi:hypothetical protein Hanom_Chr17g01539641 [Helianthus anomalus]